MSGPDDELVEAVAEALCEAMGGDDPYLNTWVDAVLSVPALRDALARDAQVREIVERQDGLVLDQAIGFIQIRSLHHAGDGWGVWAEDDIPATMLRDGKGVDNSDIMPGSEFDGPVVL